MDGWKERANNSSVSVLSPSSLFLPVPPLHYLFENSNSSGNPRNEGRDRRDEREQGGRREEAGDDVERERLGDSR